MPSRRHTPTNGRSRLDEALASLVQTQAILSQHQAALMTMITEIREDNARRDAKFEAIFLRHERRLADIERMLAELPDAIREKIGFKRR